MMIIRLTQKLAKKIKVAPTDAASRAEDLFGDWAANLFTVGRTQYIILTHSVSLFSVVFPGRGIGDGDRFVAQALAALGEQMTDAGHGDIFDQHIAPLAEEVRLSKTGDRSLLGSMNDLVQHAKWLLEDHSPSVVARRLGEIPMGALDYGYPLDVLTELAGRSDAAETGAGNVLPFPGGQSREQGAVASFSGEKSFDAQKMLEMFNQVGKPAGKRELLDRAQELLYDAWESSPARAAKLARQALEISPDCAEAYVLLSELEAATIRERIEMLRQGVAAGRRALGKQYFKDNEGHFWGMIESRPFMRAMCSLADWSWEIGQSGEAIDLWLEMLKLNPQDNQGVRYLLLSCYLECQRDEEAKALLEAYEEDVSADWDFGAALLAFRTGGDTPTARRKLAAAQRQNSHVLRYLLGRKKIPKRLPEYFTPGDETEAVSYAARNLAGWKKTPGALDWLRKCVD